MAVSGNRKWNSADVSSPVINTAMVKSRELRHDLKRERGGVGSERDGGQKGSVGARSGREEV